jgi:hypothetical protein
MSEITKRLTELYERPDLLHSICRHVANGGALTELAVKWGVDYGDLAVWIHADPTRETVFRKAEKMRLEYVVERVLHVLRQISFADIKKLYDENGRLKNPQDWDDDISSAVASIDSMELDGELDGEIKKVKLWDKLKAIELIGKNLSLFIEKKEITHSMKLEDLVHASIKDITPKGDSNVDEG